MTRALLAVGAWLCTAALSTVALGQGDTVPTPFKTSGGRLGFVVPAMKDPAGFRLLVDVDGSATGWSEWGFDRMAEGYFVFRYPPNETQWRWENEGNVAFVSHSNEMAMVLQNTTATGVLHWAADWYDDQWRVTRRYPAQGTLTLEAESLPSAPAWLEPTMPDIAELKAFSPPTLSRRLQADYLDRAWTPVATVPPFPRLLLPDGVSSATLALVWTDLRSGRQTELQPTSAATDGNRTQWRGTGPEGDVWSLVADEAADASVAITAWVQSEDDRVFRLSLGARVPDGRWTWFDDVRFSAPFQPGRRLSYDAPSPYGFAQRRSFYPFGVIASDRAVVVAATDGREPRHFQIEAESDTRTLWIHYDLATTPQTKHFPGLATIRARFSVAPRTSAQPFRVALQEWYSRDRDWWTARVPVHGLWMPFTDIGSVSNAEEFSFAFFEKVGERGADLDNAHKVGALNLIYTEPWLYWLPLANTSDWNRAAALRRMQTLADTAFGKDREFASAGLVGAVRDAAQQPRLQFLATPWSTGARMEVSTDPELPIASNAPINRAMAEWRFIKESLDDARVDGIYLDSMSALETIDYNPAALAVADYPATFVMGDLKPGIAAPIQAVEFTAALSGYLHSRNLYLMGNFPCWRFPFFMPYIDIPGEETVWYTGKQYTPMSERERNYRRAMSGAKPFGFLQATHFSELSSADLEKYFRDCLALGLLPSFFSHDGANDPYWVDRSLYERDRALFRRYLPLTVRLSEAGWRPVPAARFSAAGVEVEQFGASLSNVVWFTVRNTGDQLVSGSLRVHEALAQRIAYAVSEGRIVATPGAIEETELEAGEVAVWVLLKPEALDPLQAWFEALSDRHEQYRAGAINLASFAREQALGAVADVAAHAVASEGEPVTLRLAINENVRDRVSQTSFSALAGRWTNVAWTVASSGATQSFERMTLPRARPGLLFDGPEGRVAPTGAVHALYFAASNRSSQSKSVALHVSGDIPTAQKEIMLESGASTQIVVLVAADGARLRRILAQWRVNEQVAREYEAVVLFASPLKHLATAPGVRVTADSAFSGYTTLPLNDGVVETAGLVWHDAAFASAESSEPHWVRVQFPKPERVSSVTAHWNDEGGTLYASQRGEVWGLSADGTAVQFGSFDGASTNKSTRIAFPPVSVSGIEWRQPASGGAVARPDILWLVELEVE